MKGGPVLGAEDSRMAWPHGGSTGQLADRTSKEAGTRSRRPGSERCHGVPSEEVAAVLGAGPSLARGREWGGQDSDSWAAEA